MAWSEARTQSERCFAAYFGLLVKYICGWELTTNLTERRFTEMNPNIKTKKLEAVLDITRAYADDWIYEDDFHLAAEIARNPG